MSGKSTPTGMMKKSTAMASPMNHAMPRTAKMAENPSRNSRLRSGVRSGRSGSGMRTSCSVVQAKSAPATSSMRMVPIPVSEMSSAPSAGPAMSDTALMT